MPVPLTVTDGRRKVRNDTGALTSDWQHDKLLLSLFMSLSLLLSFSGAPSDIFFCLSFHVYLTRSMIRVAFAFS